MKNNFNKKTEVNILFVADFIPGVGYGASTYTLSILEYLLKENCNITYISTKINMKSLIELSSFSPSTKKILLKSLFRYFKFLLINPILWKEYFISFIFFLYSSLPIPIKKQYRSLKRLLLKPLGIQFKDDSDFNPNLIKNNQNLDSVTKKETIPLIQKETLKFRPQIIISNYVWMAYAFDFVDSNTLKVIITHDIMHERFKTFEKCNLTNAESHLLDWDKQTEIKALSKADLLLAIQEDEARSLKNLEMGNEIFTVPMAINFHPSISDQITGRCLFIGSQSKHNFYSLCWFLDEVWQELLEASPSIELHVCGGVGNWFKNDYKNVYFKGIVSDLSLEYSQAQICIIPNIVGSGLKIKLIEALSYGKACVSTSIGLQGLTELSNEVVLLADDPDDFCQAILELLTNNEKREKIESLAKDYVINNLSPDIVYAPLVDRFYQHINKLKN